MDWEIVIGLEVHTQLKTKSKIFSGASTAFGASPNSQACEVDLALPGVLPVFNHQALLLALRFGVAIDAHINKQSIFERKNYFYPDLPKGYQISQQVLPIVGAGKINVVLDDGTEKTICITRAHLEEDAGKSIHDAFPRHTGIDLNRAGTPLLEIVSEPDMRSAKEAVAFAKTLHTLVKTIGICDGNMQEGSFRMDVNVSVRKPGEALGTRTETKNLNSFRFVERAIEFEVERQIDIIENGGVVAQETRLYDVEKNVTRSMRSKADAHDYRYFPDPDLLPVIVEESLLQEIKALLPELPANKRERYINEYKLSISDADFLVHQQALADFFEQVIAETQAPAKTVANWVMGDYWAALHKDDISLQRAPVSAKALAELLTRIADNTISGKIAKQVFEAMWQCEGSADQIIEEKSLKQMTDTDEIEKLVDEVIANSQAQVEQYRAGKEKVFGYFVGQVMKLSKAKANPAQLNELLKSKLKP